MVYPRNIKGDDMLRVTFLLVAIFFLSACEYLDVDKCLDAGGKWNYETSECEFSDNGLIEREE